MNGKVQLIILERQTVLQPLKNVLSLIMDNQNICIFVFVCVTIYCCYIRSGDIPSVVLSPFYSCLLYLTIILRARVGYEMIDSQRGAQRRVGYNHLISNKLEQNNCFITNAPKIQKSKHQQKQKRPKITRTLTIFVGYGIMAHIPWPLSQSNSLNCIIQ